MTHSKTFLVLRRTVLTCLLVAVMVLPSSAVAELVGNPACPGEEVFYDPGIGEDIVVPEGYKVEVFAKNLNFPTGIAFLRRLDNFHVYVLESGHGLPSQCNDNEDPAFGGKFSPTNPFTPGIVIFDRIGNRIAGEIGKPTSAGGGFLPDGPAIDIAFEQGFDGGRLFATDSNQSLRTAGFNNSSRIVIVNPGSGQVTPLISGLPTGDHPAEQLAIKDGFIYWSQGSATNSGVAGLDNGGGKNQPDIPCQDIVLSSNVFDSGSEKTSGFSPHGVQRPGETVKAFEGATLPGMCTGAVLRANLTVSNPATTIEPFSWGYRNPFGIRFAPATHALKGGLFVTENGEDERGARPTNNAPDRLQLAQLNPDGSPDYHGWPDRFGFLDSTQAVFNPVGGPGDDLCVPDPTNLPSLCTAASLDKILTENIPVKPLLAFFPQPPVAPLALEPADVAAVGLDFAPDSFVHGVVGRGAALIAREGDFGFSKDNGEPPAGHDVELVNFSPPGQRFTLTQSRFAFNCKKDEQGHNSDGSPTCKVPRDQAFAEEIHGINRPITAMFGPDGALYVVDYGAVRDFGQSDPRAKFKVASRPERAGTGDGPLVQIPGTGVIWKISRKSAP
jgi:hypothetical protein